MAFQNTGKPALALCKSGLPNVVAATEKAKTNSFIVDHTRSASALQYVWPGDLMPLKRFFSRNGVQVSSLRNEEDVLRVARRLAKWPRKRANKIGSTTYTKIFAIQRVLCPGECGSGWGARRKFKNDQLGTFGPASVVRTVSPEVWEEVERRTIGEVVDV